MWINGVYFKDDMDLVIIDHMDLLTDKKITEESRKNMDEMIKFVKENNIKIKLNTETL